MKSDRSKDSGAYFPQAYLTDMFRFLERNDDKIKVLTYADFDWQDDYAFDSGYPDEKKRWLNGIKDGSIDATKAYLLIQYDLDSRPERGMSLLSHEAHQNIPANVTCFHKRVDRRHLKQTDELRYTDYDIDKGLLRKLESNGFVIAYHSNCYERSHHNYDLARAILNQDIDELKKDYVIDFYTAHGGVPCSDGLNNRDIEPLPETCEKVRWVHNGATPFFNKQYSDGGHNSPVRDPAERDIRDFVANMKPGGRYRILCHPQYYAVDHGVSQRYSDTKWYDELIADARSAAKPDTWRHVHLKHFPNADLATSVDEKKQSPMSLRVTKRNIRLADRISAGARSIALWIKSLFQ